MAHLASSFGGGNINMNMNNAGDNNNKNNNGNIRKMLDDSLSSYDDTTATSSTTTTATATNIPLGGAILIRKSALAFRYRPRVASASHGPHLDYSSFSIPLDDLSPGDQIEQQKYFELTLEFGPQRTGVTKRAESIPIVHMEMELGGETTSGGGGNSNSNSNSNMAKYLSWENEGRVYYSTKISNEWTEAYYMASITGVVFEKIIQRAVEYTYKRPRYQPFEVVSIPSRRLLLRSSGSDDFVWEMFRDLAELYVDIAPLLVPPRGRVQFYVADADDDDMDDDNDDSNNNDGRREKSGEESSLPSSRKRQQPNPNVKKVKGPLEASLATTFYENFFNCAHAIKSGDYSMYLPPPSSAPTVIPTTSMAPTSTTSGNREETTAQSQSTTQRVKSNVKSENNNDSDKLNLNTNDIDNTNTTFDTSSGTENYGENNNTTQSNDDNDQRHWQRSLDRNHSDIITNDNDDEEIVTLDTSKLTSEDRDGGDSDNMLSPSLSIRNSDDALVGSSDFEDGEESEDDAAEAAEKAVIEAAKAAENAGKF